MLQPTTKTRGQHEEGNPGNTLKYAHEYLDRGFAPVPVEFRSKACRIKDWPNLRLDHEGIEELFQPPCNVGIALGGASGGLVDVDLDCQEAIALAPHMLPPTGMIFERESKPASHWIYKAPDPGKSLKLADPNGGMLVELRAKGCMTVFPGSVHESGEEIRFVQDGDPAEIEFGQLASSVRHLAAASLLLRHWKEGNRHHLALTLSGTLLGGDMSEENARRLLTALVTAAHDGEDEDRLKCLSDTARKLKAGEPIAGRKDLSKVIGEEAANSACEWLDLTTARRDLVRGHLGALTSAYGGPASESDLANAKRFAARNGGQARYSYGLKKWFVWDGRRWAVDADGEIDRIASDTVQEMAREAVDCMSKDQLAWAAKSHNLPRLRNMVALAQSRCSVRSEDFDADPWKLNCKTGIVDLEKGELLPHHPEALMRRLAPVDFDPNAECPTFLAFLEHIFEGDEELIGFLQRAIGYSLTGLTSEQCLFVLVGNGANGKSTLIHVIQDLLGDYAQQTPMDMLMTNRSGNIPNDIARLEGTRFVAATEAEAGQRLAEAKIKQLTGGDRIAARFLNAEFFEFPPQFKLWLATNKLPEVKGTDDGIWRRFRVIPFNVTIPEAERDQGLREKLKAELPGIRRATPESSLVRSQNCKRYSSLVRLSLFTISRPLGWFRCAYYVTRFSFISSPFRQSEPSKSESTKRSYWLRCTPNIRPRRHSMRAFRQIVRIGCTRCFLAA
jgi:putative DNA primase/helicase